MILTGHEIQHVVFIHGNVVKKKKNMYTSSVKGLFVILYYFSGKNQFEHGVCGRC